MSMKKMLRTALCRMTGVTFVAKEFNAFYIICRPKGLQIESLCILYNLAVNSVRKRLYYGAYI